MVTHGKKLLVEEIPAENLLIQLQEEQQIKFHLKALWINGKAYLQECEQQSLV